jgi:hypothetical protein
LLDPWTEGSASGSRSGIKGRVKLKK